MTIEQSEILVLYGPPGGWGFRRGTWTVEYHGKRYEVFASVPHAASREAQDRIVRDAAMRVIPDPRG